MILRTFDRVLIAVAGASLLATPGAHAVEESSYIGPTGGSLQITGQRCSTLKTNDLGTALFIDGGAEEAGRNTGEFLFQMVLLGDDVDDEGPLIVTDSGRRFVQDSSETGYEELEVLLEDFINGNIPLIGGGFNEGCDSPLQLNFGSLVINRYETRLVNNQNTAKLRMDAEGSYEDGNGRDRKLIVKIRARMNRTN